MFQTKRDRYNLTKSQLDLEKATFLSTWRDIGDFLLPRRPRFTLTDVNRGERRNNRIINSTGTQALRTLRAGMMSGVTSPARPWFRLTTADPDLAENGPVKDWLSNVTDRMATVFLRSNLYKVLPTVYGDLGGFATGAMAVEEDLERVVRFYPLPIGSYSVATNDKLRVDVITRDFRMTVRQLLQRFGNRNDKTGQYDLSNFSMTVKDLYAKNQLDSWIDVTHICQPNPDYDPNRLQSKFKKYESCYYEKNTKEEVYLRESGYDYFPILVPRWETTGEDSWGTDCPGITALGDIKQLQICEKRGAQAIEKMVNPPMIAPPELRNQRSSILPGDITYLAEREGMKGFRPAHDVNLRLDGLQAMMKDLEVRIKGAFYEDLFLMLAESDRRQITAREIDERREEKLLALGPVLEQLNEDMLDPLIDITFQLMIQQQKLPPPPEDLHGQDLKVEYVSTMAQAQKLIGIASTERFAGFIGQIFQQTQDATVFDKVNIDHLVDVYGEQTSVAPGIVRSDDEAQGIRQQRAKAQQQQQQMAQVQQAADTAKSLSQADTSKDNALTRMINDAHAGQLTPTQ